MTSKTNHKRATMKESPLECASSDMSSKIIITMIFTVWTDAFFKKSRWLLPFLYHLLYRRRAINSRYRKQSNLKAKTLHFGFLFIEWQFIANFAKLSLWYHELLGRFDVDHADPLTKAYHCVVYTQLLFSRFLLSKAQVLIRVDSDVEIS